MKRAMAISGACALLGMISLLVGLLVDPTRTYFSYLAAFVFSASIAMGALLYLMVDWASKASWVVVTRRITEAIVGALPIVALLMIPLFFGLNRLYPWAMPHDGFDPEIHAKLDYRRPYCNTTFFIFRQAIYFGVCILWGERLRRWSVEDDRAPTPEIIAKTRRMSAAGLVIIGLMLAWAGFDWIVMLEPDWWSTMWGFYFFAGAFGGAIGLISFLLWVAKRTGPLAGVLTPDHTHAVGRVLLTFVIFWAYTAFGQLLIIWIGNIPSDATFYNHRTYGTWTGVTYILTFAHFVLPFIALLSRDAKRHASHLAFWGMWMVVAHYIDVYWMVLPMRDKLGVLPHWLDLGALLFIGGLSTLVALWRYGHAAALPVNDPNFQKGLRYEASVQ